MNMKIVLIMGLFIVVGAMALGEDAEQELSGEDSARLVKLVHDYKRSSPLLQRQARASTHGKCIECQHWTGLCSTCCEVRRGKKSCIGCQDSLCYTCCEA